jgi:uncharacterized phage-associated protein
VHEPRPAKAVANEIVELAKGARNPVEPLKLQKLAFFAHGWHLALYERPLLDEEVQAWKFGPVIPSVYHSFKRYGNKPITDPAPDVDDDGAIIIPRLPSNAITDRGLIARVWTVYGSFTGSQLSTMTHGPDTPWARVWETNEKGQGLRFVAIPNGLIMEYFRRQLERNSEYARRIRNPV